MAQTVFSTELPVVLGADHAGFEYKDIVKAMLQEAGFSVDDKGTNDASSVDYPDFAHPVAAAVAEQKAAFGILVCGSGEGVCITANKHADVRAALVWNAEVAALSRQHNNANVICLPARFISAEEAKTFVKIFMETAFEGGRHAKRVDKISC